MGSINVIYGHRVATTFMYRNPVIVGTAQMSTLTVTDRFYNVRDVPAEINIQPVGVWNKEINIKAVCYR